MKVTDKIYDFSPIFVQDILISLYGIKVKQQRFGATYKQELTSLQKSQYLDDTKIRSLQEHKFHSILSYCETYVPYYKKILEEKKLSAKHISLSNFREIFPIIDKDFLRKNISEFYSTDTCLNYRNINTSGTSGAPLNIRATPDAIQKNYAFFSRFLNWSNVEITAKSATFAGRTFISEESKGVFWRHNYFMNNLLMSSYHISLKNSGAYINKLEQFQPDYIDSYPSAIYEIASIMENKGIKLSHPPKAIITSSETLFSHQRKTIESAFCCTVHDQYGAAEMAIFAGECEYGKLHINPEYSYIELVDQDGNPSLPGEIGQIVCTAFLNYAMPLIRYKIGDSAILSEECCQCGRNFPILASVEGRTDDILVTPDGKKIGRLDPVFKKVKGIKESQIIQEKIDHVRILVVPSGENNGDNYNILKSELKKRLGPLVNIDIEEVKDIPRTKAGKFRAVISKIK